MTRDVVSAGQRGERKGGVMNEQVWVLGATGRTGRAITRGLDAAGVSLVLVGRDRGRLQAVAADLHGDPRLVVGSLSSALSQLGEDPPGVVVSTVGPFTITAPQVTGALPPGTHYVDVSNELASIEELLEQDAAAATKGQVHVTGAGFGVLGTESVVLRLCAGRPPAATVRVDALPAVALEAGVLGGALAATIVEVIGAGGREVRQGRLMRARPAAHYLELTTPDGHRLGTGSGANGELIAAWRASGADSVVAASSAAPASAVLRAVVPAVTALFRVPGVARLAVPVLARIPLKAADMPRPFSWGHARVEWASGQVLEGWLRVGDGTEFTAAVTVEVTRRLLDGQGRPGAHTPGSLFGPELAEAAGGEFVLDDGSGAPVRGRTSRGPA